MRAELLQMMAHEGERDMIAVSESKPPHLKRCTLVDAHAHFHPCFDQDAFLDAAGRNFQRGAGQLGLPAGVPGCLLLAGCRGEDPFARLRGEQGLRKRGNNWLIRAGDEDCVVLASREGLPPLALIAGRQIVTREGLEVLALACTARIPDGLALEDSIAAARRAGALTVLPWGFGKWWFRRGERVRRLLESADPRQIFLSDNGGRAAALGEPAVFQWARRSGFVILPGTDPLPFATQTTRAGGYGFCLECDIDLARAGSQIRAALQCRPHGFEAFGVLETFWGFVTSQVAMKTRKFIRRNGAIAADRDRIAFLSQGEK